ncbi:MAG: trimethylamine methyltransferase family protein [Clostridiales bacterium]|nr:trimethylamine methyltransferase family protein [Clostridiales bacterium]
MIKTKRPKLELLSKSFIKKIVDEAFVLLGKHGVFVENEAALTLLREAGMEIDESARRVKFTPRLIEESLSSAPSTITLYDRTGGREFVVGGDWVHFDPGSAAVTILDHATQAERKAVTEDLIKFCRLTEMLPHFHFQSTGLVSSDVPEDIADVYRLYICLQYSSKPVVTGTFRVEGFKPMFDMLVAIRGSEASLAARPLAIFDACPSPPLKWSNLTAQSLIDCSRAGIPSELISMGMTGATSPVTIAGTLVQHVAENLSGLVIAQLAKPGAPVIFGGSPSSFDMRRGTTPMGAIETMMIDVAYAQIGKYLNLPTHAYMSLSDSKVNDSQAGLETGIGAVLAALAGINVVSGPGMLNFESCQSLEKLIIDNEICGLAYRLIEGISQRDEPLALELFDALGRGMQFLTLPHTRKWYRLEHTFSVVADRETYDAWVALGKKTMADRAADRVEQLLRENLPALPNPAVVRELQEIMRGEARKVGLDRLS